jgi:Restriction Enzyme Adenine Methylase Associated/Protein of unknown function (DUF2924)
MTTMTNDLTRLVERGALQLGDELYHPKRRQTGGGEVGARIVERGVDVDGRVYPSLSTAAKAITGTATNGWTYWRLRRSNQSLADLRRVATEAHAESS